MSGQKRMDMWGSMRFASLALLVLGLMVKEKWGTVECLESEWKTHGKDWISMGIAGQTRLSSIAHTSHCLRGIYRWVCRSADGRACISDSPGKPCLQHCTGRCSRLPIRVSRS